MRLLFVSAWYPDPPVHGSKLRVFNLLRQLASRHEITLLSFNDRDVPAPGAGALRAFCDEIEVLPLRPFEPRSLDGWRGAWRAMPRSLVAMFSSDMAAAITAALRRRRYGAIIASQLTSAAYAPYFDGVPAVFEELELTALYEQYAKAAGPLMRLRHGLTWWKLGRYLGALLPAFRACTVVSERERALLARAVPAYGDAEVVPNCVYPPDYEHVRPAPRRRTLLFTGSFAYAPNHDAMRWFVADVLPLIRRHVPEVELIITGDAAGRSLPAAPGVTHVGFVDDVHARIANAWVSLAPLQVGGGTRLKILEAMVLGTPVVATTKGAEGLDTIDGTHLLLADDAPHFAAQVVRLLGDDALRDRLTRAARDLIAARYDWRVVGERVRALVDRVAGVEPA